jgi:hypothetical protein
MTQDGLRNDQASILLDKEIVIPAMANQERGRSLLTLTLRGFIEGCSLCDGKCHRKNCETVNPQEEGMNSGLHVCGKRSISIFPSLRRWNRGALGARGTANIVQAMESGWIFEEPRWTLGDSQPLCIER